MAKVLLILILFFSSVACASDALKSGTFPAFDPDFQRYRSTLSTWVDQRSLPQRDAADRALNLPFELQADPAVEYRGRFLLFHGLNDSPYVWRNYAIELTRRGFDVRAVLFAGHGTTPEDMLHVRWESWLASARDHLQAWREADDHSPIFLGGFSMGGVLATWLALDNPDIAGLLLISPAYESRLNHYLRWSGVYSRMQPWVFGGMIGEDNPQKYNSIPVNSGWQYYQLARGLKRRWKRDDRIDIPTLMILTEDDSVVDVNFTRKLFRRRFVSDQRVLLTYKSTAPAATGHSGEAAADPKTELARESAFPALRVLNQSHLGLMYTPTDPLFGIAGRVLVCNGNEYPVYSACMRSRQHWFGAQHTASPDGIPVARTTFNADWEGVLAMFDQWLTHIITLKPEAG